jgi:hypothetical protein
VDSSLSRTNLFLIERGEIQPIVISTIEQAITLTPVTKERIQPTVAGCHAGMVLNTFL